jgi:hypothetical protein
MAIPLRKSDCSLAIIVCWRRIEDRLVRVCDGIEQLFLEPVHDLRTLDLRGPEEASNFTLARSCPHSAWISMNMLSSIDIFRAIFSIAWGSRLFIDTCRPMLSIML